MSSLMREGYIGEEHEEGLYMEMGRGELPKQLDLLGGNVGSMRCRKRSGGGKEV